jgi:hypothetical protein
MQQDRLRQQGILFGLIYSRLIFQIAANSEFLRAAIAFAFECRGNG